MSQKRILHVVGAMNRGGAETMLMSLYRSLDREKYQFDFLEFKSGRSDYADEIENLGGRIIQVPWSQSPLRLLWTVRALSKVISREGPYTAVHSHVLFASGTALLAAMKAGVKTRVAHSHSTGSQEDGIQDKIYRVLARGMILGSATKFAACTSDAGVYLFGKRKFATTGRVIPNAVDMDEFRPGTQAERTDLRKELGLAPQELVLVSVARLEPVKNHTFLLHLADELKSREMDFKLLFVGDGSLRETLLEEVANRKLEGHINFLGLRDDVARILKAADVLLMPSHFEGLPVALVEAQATGLPCVISDNISRDSDLGLDLLTFLPTSDVSQWANILSENLKQSHTPADIRKNLGRYGYSIDASLGRLLELYR